MKKIWIRTGSKTASEKSKGVSTILKWVNERAVMP